MSNKKPVVVYGASGYTGRLICEYLREYNIPFIAAGRTADKLHAAMQTNVPGIYAAGDCAEAFDPFTRKTVVSAIQPNAAEQARVAALNMLGLPAALAVVTQINVLDTLGLISTSFGNWQGVPGGEQVALTDAAAGKHLSLQFEGDRLIGCNSVGMTQQPVAFLIAQSL